MTPLTLLYVEDEPDIRAIAVIALESLGGFKVHAYESGPEALAALAYVTPDLIILDVMMPGMDGLETLAKIRQQQKTARTPAVFMTAKVQSNEVSQYLATGALDVIAKPFDPMELSAQIERIWNQHISGVSHTSTRQYGR